MSDKEKDLIAKNLKFLRNKRNLTQQELAEKLGIKRSSIGAYEESRAQPKYDTLTNIADFFHVSIDQLVTLDLADGPVPDVRRVTDLSVDYTGKKIRTLVVTDDADGKPNVVLVPQKASAGYLNGYADPEYIEELPKFQLPMLGPGTFRAFEIKGDSMLPLRSGTIIIAEYLEDWRDLRNGQTYILLTSSEGIVYKRVYSNVTEEGGGQLDLRSDNPDYPAYTVDIRDVQEIWKAKMFISNHFPEPDLSNEQLLSMIMDLKQEVKRLKDR